MPTGDVLNNWKFIFLIGAAMAAYAVWKASESK